ncbi:hypothetical protein HPB50_021975 [Hyalomma asiaticum]|uniref:Uncharacterized protein n=1 Tax=Hyalomma asiaticum TaxID=266040 RepID=A0ACB7TLV6_HYAAI|nr:hypothetical protein HPB50_021975 [Hyalomma asiaticum]
MRSPLALSRCRRSLDVRFIFCGSISNGGPREPFRSGVTSVLLSAHTEASGRFRFGFCARAVSPAARSRDFGGVAFMGGPPRRSIKITRGTGGGAVSWRKLAEGRGAIIQEEPGTRYL